MRPLLFLTLCILTASCTSQSTQTTTGATDTITTTKSTKTTPPNDTTFFYEPSITIINGIICKMAVYRLDHEEDTLPLDTIIAVAFHKPISVLNLPGTDTSKDEFQQDEDGVDTVQLVMPSYHSADKFLGRDAQLKGTFYHHDNGNQKTTVLLTVLQITAGNDTALFK